VESAEQKKKSEAGRAVSREQTMDGEEGKDDQPGRGGKQKAKEDADQPVDERRAQILKGHQDRSASSEPV